MTAEQLYAALDAAGLTPPVHYIAAPHEWRMALERIEAELKAEVLKLNDEIENLGADLERARMDLELAQDQFRILEQKLEDFTTKDNVKTLERMATDQ